MKNLQLFAIISFASVALFSAPEKAMAQSSDFGLKSVDIGSVPSPGGLVDENGWYNISGSGTGFGGSADSGHFAYQLQVGDYVFVSDVWSQTNNGESGIEVRQSVDPSSPFFEVAYQAGLGTIVRYRSESGQGSVVLAQDPTLTTPVQLIIVKTGQVYQAYENDPTSGNGWTPLGDPFTAPSDWADASLVGLVETANSSTEQSAADIDDVILLPSNESSQDIGNPALYGSSDYNIVNGEPTFTVVGSGTGLAGPKDQYRFTFSWIKGNISQIVRVNSLTATSATAQAGLTVKESAQGSSREVSVVLTPTGVNLVYRSVVGQPTTTQQIAAGSFSGPIWLYLARTGNSFAAAASADGTHWTLPVSVTANLQSNSLFGLSVSSSNSSSLATAVFDNYTPWQ